MSLINEALKKAQRARTEGASADAPVPGGGAAGKGGAPKSARTMALIGGAAAVLILLSVGLTFYLLNRKPAPASPPAVAEASKPDPKKEPATPVAVTPPPAATEPPAKPEDSASTVTKTEPPAPKPADPRATAPAVAAAPAPAAQPPPPPKPDERVAAFVESVKVAGIRSSGDDSRVLMNERVFRVNDIVERTLGVRLVKVAIDSLTFADANGVTYVKYF